MDDPSDAEVDVRLADAIEFYRPDEYHPEYSNEDIRTAYRAGLADAVRPDTAGQPA